MHTVSQVLGRKNCFGNLCVLDLTVDAFENSFGAEFGVCWPLLSRFNCGHFLDTIFFESPIGWDSNPIPFQPPDGPKDAWRGTVTNPVSTGRRPKTGLSWGPDPIPFQLADRFNED